MSDPDEPIPGDYVDCWSCGGEGGHHDCGEDCCCCADPEPNVTCDICRGEGGWIVGAPDTTETKP